ncbi:ABC transporter substrate-binding protein [Halalkalibacterium ligniniphilum]|uniref:ABC transporter substrate-binding protein n=1 Tax=Halalkalibacterium ligniniphilum TaxID=1134413 RepID=UPI000345514C|nr:ABC transporter substrate-binding protein [Halalkalibacterium ligniniphilum]
MSKNQITWFLAVVILLVLSACGGGTQQGTAADSTTDKPELLIAEPVHGFGYLPLYIAVNKGFFEKVNVEMTTLAGGSAHTNAVLTGEAWAFIGGPEHNAFAKAKGADLRAIANVVNKGNVYLVSKDELTSGEDLASFVNGKTVVTGQYGGTPNSITRFLLEEWGLEVNKDVRLLEVENSAIPTIISEGQGDIAVVSDPILEQGINEGIWNEPFYNVPNELGPYAYSTINVRLDTIKDNPDEVIGFMEGLVKGLEFIQNNPEEALDIAKQEFPTMDETILEAMMTRALDDGHWEFSGEITEDSIIMNLKVVENAGMLEEQINYEDIVNPQFFE